MGLPGVAMSSEVVQYNEDTATVAIQPQTSVGLFGSDDPVAVVQKATRVANALADIIKAKKLYANIQGRSHVLVEGWTLLGSMLGVFPVCIWTKPILDEAGVCQGWEARVEAKTRAGEVVGAAEAQCLRSENQWGWEPKGRDGRRLQPRDDFALRSMAQTRATAKALRLPLGFVVVIAGYEACPAEELMVAGAEAEALSGEDSNEAKAPPAIESASNPMPTQEWLRKAAENREAAVEKHAGLSTKLEASIEHAKANKKADETPKQAVERIAREADEAAGRPKSVPRFCSCGAAVIQCLSSDGISNYWRCRWAVSEREKMKEQGIPAQDIKNDPILKEHYFHWSGGKK